MNQNGFEKAELVPVERPAPLMPAGRVLSSAEADSLSGQDELSLAAYWGVLLKRRWTVATAVFVLGTIAAIVSYRTTPVYRATARVELEAETPLVQSLNQAYQKMEADDAFLQTQ